MKKVISFSVWGTNPKYTVGAVKNAKLAQTLFPDWICRFYIGQSTISGSKRVMKELRKLNNVEIIEMNEEGDWTGMFWRFLPASDPEVDVMISRDTDSRLTVREKFVVEQWFESDKSFHIIRDHPFHSAKIMGGMWGARGEILFDMSELIDEYKKGDFWQVDQNFLSEIVFDKIKDDCFVHDEFFSNNPIDFPRENYEFIGQVFDGGDVTVPEHVAVLRQYLENKK